VYKLKQNEAGEVVGGFLQQEGIDYDEVFAPVACMESVCLLFALAT
jgi:hypothetical protein